ncbi:inositol polyphosphate multikinase beta-like [Musa acuminata AAA Group]|uniref:inositol polyphosphate multikinase beta-like n=1 Tax=Musa acuminata AAA Group TaxID=214697 RepID=UPI0031D664CB
MSKCLAEDRATTSIALGFHVFGVQIQNPGETDGFWCPPGLTSGRTRLERFDLQNSACDDKKPDCAFAPAVYGGPNGVLAQLLEPRRGLRTRRTRSILLQSGKSSGMQMKLVDFAHVAEGDGSRR